MGKQQFTVELTDKKVVYHGGETISGNLVLETDDSVETSFIQATMKGKAFVRWTEGGGQNTRYYSGKEKFFKHDQPLMIPGGYVRYSLKGLIQRGGLHRDLRTKMLFTVLDVVDLNDFADAKQPSAGSKSKVLCCWCCASAPIEGKVNADKTGYVPGEIVRANGSIDNRSNSNLADSHFGIVQMVTQHASMKSRTFPVEVTAAPGLGCKRRSTVQLNPQTLQIPPVPPSNLRFCRIMKIEYFLQLTVETGRCHVNLRPRAPLHIGTIPLRNGDDLPQPPQPAATSPPLDTTQSSFHPLASTDFSAAQPAAYQAPLASYAAAGSAVTVSKKGYDGPATYTPQYNYYDWSQSAFTYK